MNLKRVRKRDLCSLIRFLNFYYLNQDRIHYFSIRVKDELVKDLGRLYKISDRDGSVYFTSIYEHLPDFRLVGHQWYQDGKAVTLPRSRKECVRKLHIVRKPVTIFF